MIKIGLYLLLTIALLVSLNFYVSSTEMYKGKTEKIDANFKKLGKHERKGATSTKVKLVIGNSYVAASFVPGNNDDKIVVFTVFGMPMVDMVGIIEHLPENTVVDSVLIGLGYNYASPVGGSSSSYDMYFTSSPLRKLWASIPLVRGRSIASTALKEDVKCLLSPIVAVECSKEGGDEVEAGLVEPAVATPVDAEEHLKELRKSTQRRYKEYEPFTSQLSDKFAVYLRRMREECERRNIKLYAYTAPIYSELHQKLTQGVLDEFREAVGAADIEYADLNLVFPDWGAEMFSDATHIAKRSAGKQTTEYLLNFIGRQSPAH